MNARARQQVDLQDLEPDDRELVLAFKRGDKGSYQAIHDRYRGRVRGVCMRMLDRADDADEAAQETFMKVYTSLPSFNGRYQLGAWMARIATNVCLDHLRSAKRRPSDATDHETMAQLPQASQSEGPEQLLIAADDAKQVRSVLARLSPMHRAAIALREFEGMSYADIAVALGMTEPQVKALLHRARKAFRRSWPSTGLAALLPWNLLARFRKTEILGDAGQATHVAHVAAPGINSIAACSAALQHCGAFVTDRAAGAFTALIVGTAAVGVAVAPGPHAAPTKPVQIEVVAKAGPNRDAWEGPSIKREHEEPHRPAKDASAPAPLEPEAEPTPTSDESSPQESPEGEQPSDDGGTEKPPVAAGPPPLYTYFGWERGQAIPRAQATSHSHLVDCDERSVTHQVDTWIADGAFSYQASFSFTATATSARVEFTVSKDGRQVQYTSWGPEPAVLWTLTDADSRLEITGEYGALYGQDPDAAKLPKSGSFHATLTLDCSAQTVVTEGASFTTE